MELNANTSGQSKSVVLFTGAVLLCFGWSQWGMAQTQNVPSPLRLSSDRSEQERHAREAVEGYYDALRKGRFEEAGSFMHPNTVEPIRFGLLQQIKKATPAQQKATFRELGVTDMTELEGLSPGKFFGKMVSSQYGRNMQIMSHPELKSETKIKKVNCVPAGGRCIVEFELHISPKGQDVVINRNKLQVMQHKGRWLVGEMPTQSSSAKKDISTDGTPKKKLPRP